MIDINNISISYRTDHRDIMALSSISLHVDKGEYVAIMGRNGSGKSTLVKAICGLVRINEGTIYLLGKDVRLGYFGDDYFGRVGVVFQEPEGQFLMRDVETEIISVLQNLGLLNQAQRDKFKAIVEKYALSEIINKKPENLSGGQMQTVNLACALSTSPEILILDEPTTYLDSYYKNILLNHLDSLHKAGVTIIHVTQYFDEAVKADRICIVENGSLSLDQSQNNIIDDSKLLYKLNLTPPVAARFKKTFGFSLGDGTATKSFCSKFSVNKTAGEGSARKGPDLPPENILSLKKLKFRYPNSDFTLEIDNLDFHKGEIIGLIGATGSGKSTLGFLLAGLIESSTGVIEYTGRALSSYNIKELRSKIGIAWQLSDLAMLGPTVKEDIEFGLHNLGIENFDILSILRKVRLDGFVDRIVDTLSGGEKRKLSLAWILAANPEMLILDEPTAFLDPQSQAELTTIIRGLAIEGKSLIIAGHDLQFISRLADRIVGIKDGRLIVDMSAVEFFSNASHLLSLELPSDQMIYFRQELAEKGFQFPNGSLEPEDIRNYLNGHLSELS